MWIFVALGNPGVEYELSRHNYAWLVADAVEDRSRIVSEKKTPSYKLVQGRQGGKNFFLCKPLTFMNRSGLAVANVLSNLDADVGNLVVMHDDLDIPFGGVRLKSGGGPGGHKGLISILRELGRPDFLRMRLGIGTEPKPPDGSDYVLGIFSEGEMELLEETIVVAAEAALELLHTNYLKVQSRINRRQKQ